MTPTSTHDQTVRKGGFGGQGLCFVVCWRLWVWLGQTLVHVWLVYGWSVRVGGG